MKHPKLLFVKENDTSLFDIRYEKAKFFENSWHYHAELELTLITKSTGMRFVFLYWITGDFDLWRFFCSEEQAY